MVLYFIASHTLASLFFTYVLHCAQWQVYSVTLPHPFTVLQCTSMIIWTSDVSWSSVSQPVSPCTSTGLPLFMVTAMAVAVTSSSWIFLSQPVSFTLLNQLLELLIAGFRLTTKEIEVEMDILHQHKQDRSASWLPLYGKEPSTILIAPKESLGSILLLW